MTGYRFNTAPELRVGLGTSREVGAYCTQLGIKRPLLVTDPGLATVGLVEPVREAMAATCEHVGLFSEVTADPAESVVLDALLMLQAGEADGVVGLGGGSSMDVAKAIAVLAAGTQALAEAYGVDQVVGGRLPLILIPTTAGTGSEVTPVAVITTGETTKAGISSPVLLPDIAVLDAELTLGLPAHVTAMTGIDAMVHAIEAYTSKIKKNPLSDMLAREALRLLAGNLDAVVQDGGNREARQAMLLGALLAGQAFANAPVAAVHALAYPLGGHFHIPHGLSNALVLPTVVEFNAPAAAPLYAELAPLIVGPGLVAGDTDSLTAQMISALAELSPRCGLPSRLRDAGVPKDALEMLARDAMLQQRLLVNNPREVTEADALAIYNQAY